MAKKIQAIQAFRPRIAKGKTAGLKELTKFITMRTGLNEGAISNALKELRDAVAFYNLSGRPVKLEGLGIYGPSLKVDGTFKVTQKLDSFISNELNKKGAFTGDILNRENIGSSTDDLIALWNAEHPDDLVE